MNMNRIIALAACLCLSSCDSSTGPAQDAGPDAAAGE